MKTSLRVAIAAVLDDRQQPPPSLRTGAGMGLLILVLGMFTACSSPNPNTPAAQTEIAGQKCTLCRLENPGDVTACYGVCMRRIEDEAAGKAFQHQ